MSVALATAIENSFASYIYSTCGISGTGLDPDLPVAQRLKECTGGYSLDEMDFRKGPVVRLWIESITKVTDELGYGSSQRESTNTYVLHLSGVTAPSTDRATIAAQARLLEHIIRLKLLTKDLGSISTGDTPPKLEYASVLLHNKSSFDLASSGTDKVTFVGFFQQWWSLTTESFAA